MVQFRLADESDAAAVAALHADSWRRHYRGAYADAFLDGDVVSDRLAVWEQRLSSSDPRLWTVLAQDDGLVGFAHAMLEADPTWGALVENLHVVSDRKRGGIGSQLMARCGEFAAGHDTGLYLWVLEQNTAAQAFYAARGGECVQRDLVPPPGGVAERLNGSPACLRIAWRDPAVLYAASPRLS
jgi:GNAT superfamily N-acetyltransferase